MINCIGQNHGNSQSNDSSPTFFYIHVVMAIVIYQYVNRLTSKLNNPITNKGI